MHFNPCKSVNVEKIDTQKFTLTCTVVILINATQQF